MSFPPPIPPQPKYRMYMKGYRGTGEFKGNMFDELIHLKNWYEMGNLRKRTKF